VKNNLADLNNHLFSMLERLGDDEIMNAISRDLEEPDCVKVSRFANPAEHPLVMDKRCLDFYWWPEAVPECFKNVEMDA